MSRPRRGAALLLALGAIVYASLVPFELRPLPLEEALARFRAIRHLQLGLGLRADWVANILLYLPAGFAGAALALGRPLRAGAALARAAGLFLALLALAAGIEFVQIFFSPRTVSLNDIHAEAIGAALGINLWLLAGPRLAALARALAGRGPGGPRPLAAAFLLVYLALALFPYDLLASRAELAWKLTGDLTGWWLAPACAGGCATGLAAEAAAAVVAGAALRLLTGRTAAAAAAALAAAPALEAAQILVASGVAQGASALARTLGALAGVLLAAHLRPRGWLPGSLPWRLAALAWCAAVPAAAWWGRGPLLPLDEALARLAAVRWIPFYYHYFTTEAEAVRSLVAHLGLYLPAGLLVAAARPRVRVRPAASAAAVAALALGVETGRLFLAGIRPDPTNVLIGAAAGWAGAWLLHLLRRPAADGTAPPPPAPGTRWAAVPVLLAALALVPAARGLGLVRTAAAPPEPLVDERALPTHPAPSTLPVPALPQFRTPHPRLPAPTAADLARLRRDNPGYLQAQRALAARGGSRRTRLEAAVLAAYAEPGGIDLGDLARRLLALKVRDRGHDQVLPLAMAYDWLHDRWSPEQRRALLDKLLAGCGHVVEFIRSARLSPYNVILYNAPLQALVACSVATFGEDPRAAPLMAFAHHLVWRVVVPAWRQVMGVNGGWHEGAEYVGIGIGDAVYKVPAMWAATGEDLFAAVPGLRGFLDFLVYRTRPDGSHMRWGDGAWFDRDSPDRLALALRHRHAAAYSLGGCPRTVEPTSWPWGPLTDPALCDPGAAARLPWASWFDGIGMLIARSDWSARATWVSFKAGDNYWSHSHLDQGAFTLFKGGALAIDSGYYGPRYGSDHHMNYAYQSIAHNVVTVTDPDDTVPAPAREGPRPIANDGGQRRIGSGWGVEPAPLDRAEWERRRETYHTAEVLARHQDARLAVVVADLTPAYTNARSGEGTFSHRTRRVERYVRTFLYDRGNDVVLVHDRLRASRAAFRKRWLLHTRTRPAIAGRRFTVQSPATVPGLPDGVLVGEVLAPGNARIHAIGGPGFEFWVDGRNYDEQGTLWRHIAGRHRRPPRPEPGRWRLELSADEEGRDARFLVALVPRLAGDPLDVRIRRLEAGGRLGAEIAGPAGPLRVWFDDGDRVEVEGVGRIGPAR
ncbi:VanZ family protein [Inmirania thermothiophila]|uniref:VanZ like protein n=1 Tax=Inmirania thermothiophila TaxID=1750597 RepID=A0A3N1XSL9_9GAMM|nr:VanZ family protein [Inmirania thermothiophila]ROR29644.1 VanZ like protein [Inmirania thermothiophila]